ncbi:MAG: hypothetical protein J2P17_06545 [Mycobacterium sp.]|nr:hypothetical protein [Mycobacterium sp.]
MTGRSRDPDALRRTRAAARSRNVVREPIGLRSGYANDDFTRNLIRFVSEERLNLAITRPAATCNISGLPTS